MALEVSLFPVDAKTCIWILFLEYKQTESLKVAKSNNEHFVNEGEGGDKGGDEDVDEVIKTTNFLLVVTFNFVEK